MPSACRHCTKQDHKRMSNYRRWRQEGGTYFFTLVTYNRQPILTTDIGRNALREAILNLQAHSPCDFVAIVLLPDHLHAVIRLPVGDFDYSTRWRQIKTRFTQIYLRGTKHVPIPNASRRLRQEQTIWQRRFYEHTILEESDLKRCIDYIHLNPVKHRLVARVQDWPWSSFHRFVREGEYAANWGSSDEWFEDEFKKWE